MKQEISLKRYSAAFQVWNLFIYVRLLVTLINLITSQEDHVNDNYVPSWKVCYMS